MTPVAFVVLVMVICIVIGMAIMLALGLAARPPAAPGLTSPQKEELRNLRTLKTTIERLAISNQDVNPELSYQIRDEIRNYEMKELN